MNGAGATAHQIDVETKDGQMTVRIIGAPLTLEAVAQLEAVCRRTRAALQEQSQAAAPVFNEAPDVGPTTNSASELPAPSA